MKRRVAALVWGALGAGLAGCWFDASDLPHADASVASCTPLLDAGTQVWLDSTCNSARCDSNFHQLGCQLTIDSDAICVGTLVGTQDGFQPSASVGECKVEAPRSGAVLSLSCLNGGSACAVDLYAQSAPRLRATTIRLIPNAVTSSSTTPLGAEDFQRPAGYLAGIAPLSDGSLVALSYGGATSCAQTIQMELLSIDPARGAVTRTATAGPCLSSPLADPSGSGFLALRLGASAALVRFDARGRQLEERPNATLRSDLMLEPVALIASVGGVFAVLSERGAGRSCVIGFDPSTLDETGERCEMGSEFVSAIGLPLALSPGGAVAISEAQRSNVRVYSGAQLSELPITDIRNQARELSTVAGALGLEAGSQSLLVASVGPRPGLFIYDARQVVTGGAREIRDAVFFERAAQPTAIGSWPPQPGLAIVGLTELGTPSPQAWAALFDVAEGRYLPGAVPIGVGLVSAIVSDAQGGVELLIPASATLVRVEAR